MSDMQKVSSVQDMQLQLDNEAASFEWRQRDRDGDLQTVDRACLVFNLCGAKLGRPLPPDGVLRLHPGQRLPVPGAGRGDSAFLDPAVVAVQGGDSRVKLKRCRVRVKDCELSGAPNAGVSAEGAGSIALATRTLARGCEDGFLATGRGTVRVRDCTARDNTARGFVAFKHSRMLLRGPCRAEHNGEPGYMAQGRGAKLEAPEGGCVAVGNRDSGFLAWEGGQVIAGDACVAWDNEVEGFAAEGKGAKMRLGAGCDAARNKACGFVAAGGGEVQVGDGCTAHHNGSGTVGSGTAGSGFAAMNEASMLRTGRRCVASDNAESGFIADLGGSLQSGAGCKARNNAGEGWISNRGSRITVGRGSVAEGNQDGFVASGKGSELQYVGGGGVGAGVCAAVGNGGSGFVSGLGDEATASTRGGSMRLGPGVRSEGNGGYGCLTQGRGAVIELPEQCVLRGNTAGPKLHAEGGKFGLAPSASALLLAARHLFSLYTVATNEPAGVLPDFLMTLDADTNSSVTINQPPPQYMLDWAQLHGSRDPSAHRRPWSRLSGQIAFEDTIAAVRGQVAKEARGRYTADA
eukprot:XP_001689984.1 predicted protein [Chlamydomonas reinhardtii]